MNNLCADIGWKSINHEGEQLCGDHIDIVEKDENSTVIVLADGLGSGVKASILSTLTSKIISTMLAEGISLEECVSTIAATLPICSVRGVAYSTFTIMHLIENARVELIQYDNPSVIFIRDGDLFDYPKQELSICEKKVLRSQIKLQEGAIMIAISTPAESDPASVPPSASGPKRMPIAIGTRMASRAGITISRRAALVEISTHFS